MNRAIITAATVFTLLTANLCLADTLVITYRSGKTQTVVLDEPSTTINSWQFVNGTTAVTPQQLQPKPQQESTKAGTIEPAKDSAKAADKTPEKKSGIRVKWNAKPIPD